MPVQIAYARRPLARRNTFAGLTPLGRDEFEGYASLFGVRDGAGDMVAPGAFAASLRRRGPADVRLLYQHFAHSPIGVWDEIAEDGRGLPGGHRQHRHHQPGHGGQYVAPSALCRALTLTHNATSLILPGGASIVTAAGDCALFASDASGYWRCHGYSRASGQPVAGALSVASVAASGTITGANISTTNPVALGSVAGSHRWDSGGTGPFILRALDSGDALTGIDVAGVKASSNVLAGGATGWNSTDTRIEGKGGIALSGWCLNGGDIAVQARADNAGGYAFAAYYTTSLVGSISYTGGGSGVAYNTTSDARLKTVCGEQADYRAAIQALWVGDFTWKDNGAPGFGVLAQQAHAVMPHHQGVTKPATDDGIWHASAEPFGHLALWGVKDLYAMLEALAARVAALEAAHDAG